MPRSAYAKQSKALAHERSTCEHCGADIYLNVNGSRDVKAWCHRDTGSRFCELTEQTVATPTNEKD